MSVSADGWFARLRKRALDLGLYGQQDYRPFLILGRSRVGSNLLRGLLNAHPQVTTFGEIFRDAESFDWDHVGYFQSRSMHARMRQDPVRFIDTRVLGRYPLFIRAVGFKLFYYHARSGVEAGVWPYLRDRRELRVIHLKRRNLLQTHLSRKRAALTGRWVETSNQPGVSNGQGRPAGLRLDYRECLDDFVQTRTWEEECDRFFSGHDVLELQYEALADDYHSAAQRLQEFLGVDARHVGPTTYRQMAQPLSAMIANYAELKERFQGTQWSEFFIE